MGKERKKFLDVQFFFVEEKHATIWHLKWLYFFVEYQSAYLCKVRQDLAKIIQSIPDRVVADLEVNAKEQIQSFCLYFLENQRCMTTVPR